MADSQGPDQRSWNMSRIRGKDTTPELIVRRLLHARGYRYRLHRRDLPGKPDLVFPGRRKIILVHGCFWHSDTCKRGKSTPKTNAEFWNAKRERTRQRDREQLHELEDRGWKVLVTWECEVKDTSAIEAQPTNFLNN